MDVHQTIHEILSQTPDLADFFAAHGLPSNAGDARTKQLTLKSALLYKHIAADNFCAEAARFLSERAGALMAKDAAQPCDLLLRIPCVVQLPVEEATGDMLKALDSSLRLSTELVEFGASWLSDILSRYSPAVIVGGGVEGMANLPGVAEKYEAPKGALHPDFAGMEDPRGTFRVISGIPLVMVVDEAQLGWRAVPEKISDLLDEAYENSVIYPDDGHMMDSIFLFYFYLLGGMEAVKRFKKACIRGVHPSQMIKYGGMEEKPAVMLMPYIFGEIKAKEQGMRVVWPQDGAPIIPLLACVRRDASDEEKQAADFLSGERVGRLLMEQGMFPSAHPAVRNHLPGKLQFVGWENIYQANLPELLPVLKKCFLED